MAYRLCLSVLGGGCADEVAQLLQREELRAWHLRGEGGGGGGAALDDGHGVGSAGRLPVQITVLPTCLGMPTGLQPVRRGRPACLPVCHATAAPCQSQSSLLRPAAVNTLASGHPLPPLSPSLPPTIAMFHDPSRAKFADQPLQKARGPSRRSVCSTTWPTPW